MPLTSFRRSLRSYPWGHHALCLAPSVILLCILAVMHGTGLELARYYEGLRHAHPQETLFWEIVTETLIPALYLVYAGILVRGIRDKDRRQIREVLIFLVLQLLIAFLLVRVLKICIGKPRPDMALRGGDYTPFTLRHGFHAFPSGHAADITGLVAPLAKRWKNVFASLGLGALVALTAYSRLYLGMHHMADLAGGACLGALSSLLVHHFCARGST